MPIEPNGPAPYAPVKHVLGVVGRVRDKGLPPRLDKDYLERTGLGDPYANRTLRALRLLGLVSEDGMPTDAFRELGMAGDDYPTRLEQIIRTAYASVFEVVDPATDADEQIEHAFRKFHPAAQRDKMVTLFLGLSEEAGIIPPGRGPRKRGRTQLVHKREIGTPVVRQSRTAAPEDPPPPQNDPPPTRETQGLGHVDEAILAIVRKLPAGGASWTARERDRWLTALKGNLDLVIEVSDPKIAGGSPEES